MQPVWPETAPPLKRMYTHTHKCMTWPELTLQCLLSLLQDGWRGEALRDFQDRHRLWVRRALQPLQLPPNLGASLPAHLPCPAQRLAECNPRLPGACSAAKMNAVPSSCGDGPHHSPVLVVAKSLVYVRRRKKKSDKAQKSWYRLSVDRKREWKNVKINVWLLFQPNVFYIRQNQPQLQVSWLRYSVVS